MKSTISKISSTMLLIIAFVMGGFTVSALGQGQSDDNSIVGVWKTVVTPINCQTGDPLSPTSFRGLLTFNSGGTMAEYGVNPFTPYRSPGHGLWTRKFNRRDYSFAFVFLRLNAAGGLLGTQEIRQISRLDRSGNVLNSTGSSQSFDLDGNVVGTGCARSTALRFVE